MYKIAATKQQNIENEKPYRLNHSLFQFERNSSSSVMRSYYVVGK
jgi:hypothetical protein